MRLLSALTVCTLASACMTGPVDEAEPDVGLKPAQLVSGIETTEHPEVGVIWTDGEGPCTATLIGRRAIVTAAHCFKNRSNPNAGMTNWPFIFKNGQSWREITGYVSLRSSEGIPDRDIAVARLNNEVTPATDGVLWDDLGLDWPSDPNALVEWLGFGCGDFYVDALGKADCTPESNFDVKRIHIVPWSFLKDSELSSEETNAVNIGVGGDSGGPVLYNNRVLLTLSDTTLDLTTDGRLIRGRDRFASLPPIFSQIIAALSEMGVAD